MAVELRLVREDVKGVAHFGALIAPNGRRWATLEHAANALPVGRYRMERHSGEAFPRCWVVINPTLGAQHTSDSMRLVRQGNYVGHVGDGSICIGKNRVARDSAYAAHALTQSRDALNELWTTCGGALEVFLTIEDFSNG